MCVRVSRTVTITEEMVKQYELLSGDDNPIHLDVDEARKYHFERPIAHGMIVMGFGAQVVAALAEESCVISEYEMDFLKPVFVNDTVHLIAEDSSDSNYVEIKGIVNGEKVIKGKARYEREMSSEVV